MITDYIKFYINTIKFYVRNYILNCKCDKLSREIDELKEKLISIENTKKSKYVVKNGRIEVENGI